MQLKSTVLYLFLFIGCFLIPFCSDETGEEGACLYSARYAESGEISETTPFAVFCEEDYLEDECACGSIYGGDCNIAFKKGETCKTLKYEDKCQNGYFVEDELRDCGQTFEGL